MKVLRTGLAALLATLFALPAPAIPPERIQATLMSGADVTAGTYVYTWFGDLNSAATLTPVTGVWGPGTAMDKKAVTSGSSTTVTANTAGQLPFRGLAAGDLLIFPHINGLETPGGEERVIVTFTDGDNIVVDAAIDLTGGFPFRFKKKKTATAADQGYWSVSGFRRFNIQFDVNTINSTSLDATVECRVAPQAAANTMFTQNFTAVGSVAVSVESPQDECRIGWKQTGDAGTQSVAAYIIGEK